MTRRACSSHLLVLLVLSTAVAFAVASVAGAAPCWRPPAPGLVVDPFREPACAYCPGNRGIEYRVGPATPVSAVAAGEVTWAGSIAGVRWIVVRHVDGWRVTYGRLASTTVHTGDRVLARSRLGTASGSLYFGVRVDGRYVDPAPHLGQPVGRRRLVPVDGSTPRPPPAPQWRCGR